MCPSNDQSKFYRIKWIPLGSVFLLAAEATGNSTLAANVAGCSVTSSSGTSLLPAKSEPGLAMPQVSAKGEEEAVVAACRLEKNIAAAYML